MDLPGARVSPRPEAPGLAETRASRAVIATKAEAEAAEHRAGRRVHPAGRDAAGRAPTWSWRRRRAGCYGVQPGRLRASSRPSPEATPSSAGILHDRAQVRASPRREALGVRTAAAGRQSAGTGEAPCSSTGRLPDGVCCQAGKLAARAGDLVAIEPNPPRISFGAAGLGAGELLEPPHMSMSRHRLARRRTPRGGASAASSRLRPDLGEQARHLFGHRQGPGISRGWPRSDSGACPDRRSDRGGSHRERRTLFSSVGLPSGLMLSRRTAGSARRGWDVQRGSAADPVSPVGPLLRTIRMMAVVRRWSVLLTSMDCSMTPGGMAIVSTGRLIAGLSRQF